MPKQKADEALAGLSWGNGLRGGKGMGGANGRAFVFIVSSGPKKGFGRSLDGRYTRS